MFKKTVLAASVVTLFLTPALSSAKAASAHSNKVMASATATPIKHLVVIFQENVSFDHYFATYPNAANPDGEPAFKAAAGTPQVNGLSQLLLNRNPNLNPANGDAATNPFRLDRSQAATADMEHNYMPEQQAFDDGKMDLFPLHTGKAGSGGAGAFNTKGLVMGYYDGNTVTALWNYAQHYAMSDNSFSTNFGPSSPGAINLVSGQTGGVVYDKGDMAKDPSHVTPDGLGGYTLIGDAQPSGDICSSKPVAAHMTGKNIGDFLNSAGITWGWFEGGFDLSMKNANGTTGCKRSSNSAYTGTSADYIPHHQPFQYYASTANPDHTRPSSVDLIGTSKDGANHQYDSHDFFDALARGNMPAVSYLKAPAYQDGHAGYSNPLDEQQFVVNAVNAIMKSRFWKDTAIVILYDDSDGWYDHVMGPIVNSGNANPADSLSLCKDRSKSPMAGPDGLPVAGRCGYGTRQPFLVISPYAKTNFVDHGVTDQTSVLKFIEDNWLGGQRISAGSFDNIAGDLDTMLDFKNGGKTAPLMLDSTTGLKK